MKNELMDLRDELGNKLRRGNGGGWEFDFREIKSAFPVWVGARDGNAWATDSIGDIASAFAIWILYAFHAAEDRTVPASLTNVNNPKSETASFEHIFREPVRSVLTATNVVQTGIAIDALRELFAAWESRTGKEKRCENCDAIILDVDVKTYSAAPGVPFVPICSIDCAAELDRKHQAAKQPIATVVEMPADNAAAAVTPPVQFWPEYATPDDARLCDACKRWFTGPAKLDAKNTFCSDDCGNDFRIAHFQSKNPAVTLRPPSKD